MNWISVVIIYSITLIGLMKAIPFFGIFPDYVIFISSVVASLISFFIVKEAKSLVLAFFLYLVMFSIDYFWGVGVITSSKTESFYFGLVASIFFVFPMLLGFLCNYIIQRIKM
ncbi:hypothetical protein [Moritella sp.]|uniref:hypothetical protein n=1 Tax=Moritella sp. TaxID=78556 RepID=UPI001E14FF30|nr:hypothetical protein [Moritella sp.]MCJ8351305.1 hypothetical protein [Moritella sp.]NQZ41293.1 hypothetical protein [Moritella sp.]